MGRQTDGQFECRCLCHARWNVGNLVEHPCFGSCVPPRGVNRHLRYGMPETVEVPGTADDDSPVIFGKGLKGLPIASPDCLTPSPILIPRQGAEINLWDFNRSTLLGSSRPSRLRVPQFRTCSRTKTQRLICGISILQPFFALRVLRGFACHGSELVLTQRHKGTEIGLWIFDSSTVLGSSRPSRLRVPRFRTCSHTKTRRHRD